MIKSCSHTKIVLPEYGGAVSNDFGSTNFARGFRTAVCFLRAKLRFYKTDRCSGLCHSPSTKANSQISMEIAEMTTLTLYVIKTALLVKANQ